MDNVLRPYWQSLAFGRFNIPHMGHVDLIESMMQIADVALVYMSDAPKNGDLSLRQKLFYRCTQIYGLDYSRFAIRLARTPWAMCDEAMKIYGYEQGMTVLRFGRDQEVLARKLGQDYGIEYSLNDRIGSSTQIRHLIDHGCEDELRELYEGDTVCVELAKELRRQELQ